MNANRRTLIVTLAVALGMASWSPSAHAAEDSSTTAVTGSSDSSAALVASAKGYLDAAEASETKAEKVTAYEKARDTAKEILAADPDNADAHFIVFAADGRLELLSGAVPNPVNLYKAQGRLDHVLELDPSHPAGLAAKGGLYRQLPWALGGNLDKAESFLKRAIEEDPESIGARLELAATYLDKGEPEKSGPLIDEAVAIAEKQGKVHRVEEAEKLRAEIASH